MKSPKPRSMKKIKVVYPDGRAEMFTAAEIWTCRDRIALIDENGHRYGAINVNHIRQWHWIK